MPTKNGMSALLAIIDAVEVVVGEVKECLRDGSLERPWETA